jgi:hypothetical protein
VSVTDNTANMLKAVPELSKKIDIGLESIDHLLNLAVRAANAEVEQIADAIQVIFITFVEYVSNKMYLYFL